MDRNEMEVFLPSPGRVEWLPSRPTAPRSDVGEPLHTHTRQCVFPFGSANGTKDNFLPGAGSVQPCDILSFVFLYRTIYGIPRHPAHRIQNKSSHSKSPLGKTSHYLHICDFARNIKVFLYLLLYLVPS
jgi:hypothetical protein